jgi:hypothetical protein
MLNRRVLLALLLAFFAIGGAAARDGEDDAEELRRVDGAC